MPPTALSRPTRRNWSAIRPPTSIDQARYGQQAQQPAAHQQDGLFARVSAPVLPADGLPRDQVRVADVAAGVAARGVPVGERLGPGRVGELEVRAGSRAAARTWPGSARPPRSPRSARDWATAALPSRNPMPEVGQGAAVTAIPATRNGRPFRVTRSPAWMPSASAKLRSTTTPPVAHPAALGQLRLIDRGGGQGAAFGEHRVGMAVLRAARGTHWEWPAAARLTPGARASRVTSLRADRSAAGPVRSGRRWPAHPGRGSPPGSAGRAGRLPRAGPAPGSARSWPPS